MRVTCTSSFWLSPLGASPIALLPSVYRVWAKARMTFVREWASQLCRPYLALGVQKATTGVAARLLVHAEAHTGDDPTRAPLHAIVDIAKCFDKIPWRKLLASAGVHQFP
eukprot:6102291-Pyramimonas_sp.AAC.1